MNGNIILVVGGESFHVEKEKLRESSDYFRAMFSSQFQEEQSERIELKSVELEPFRTLLQWVQSGLSQAHMETISTVELMDILETSNMLQFSQVRTKCSGILCSRLGPDNCWQSLQLADLVSDSKLFKASQRFILRNFDNIFQHSHLPQLDKNNFVKILSSPFLNVGSERHVLQAITAWLEVNKPQDRATVRDIFQSCLYLKGLSSEDVEELKSNEHFLSSSCNEDLMTFKTQKRKLPTVPCVVGHVYGKNNSKSVCIFNWRETERKVGVLCHIPSVQADQVVASGFKVSSEGESLVLSGGEFSLGYSKTSPAFMCH